MATIEIKIPSPGESITHVELSRWLVKEGDVVRKNTEIAELESDKATLMLVAEESGRISLKAAEGEMLEVGTVACTIDSSVQTGDAAEAAPVQPDDASELLSAQPGDAPQPAPPRSSDTSQPSNTSQPSVEESGK